MDTCCPRDCDFRRWDRAVILSQGQQCASQELGKQMIEAAQPPLDSSVEAVLLRISCSWSSGRCRLDLCTPQNFMKQLADLHTRSTFPTGQFGFHMVTCVGPNAQDTTWDSSWSAFHTRLLRQFYDCELSVCGPSNDAKYEAGMEVLLTSTIPALLEPLQADGRTLNPSLVHGDLWEENCGTDFDGGQPKILDPAAFYAHNEYDFAAWRSENVPFGRPHYRQYFKHIPPSEPKEQWDDRNKLYAIRAEVHRSSLWPALCESQREIVLGYLTDLTAKYAKGDAVDGAADPRLSHAGRVHFGLTARRETSEVDMVLGCDMIFDR
ncbi:uncharacterized protein CLAFUR5_04418 [Fulvia fulva]|uniref:protein-ribulosamine 3-kinase n=1 Tax=Passalora fulva TaxID=5499 RepID=A0A9Q8LFR1_PASFU|nr:uncharacterized protein CLAFUR5_04418 [Fulvia fulva]UJO16776.1 hypothetical protein CLAFUR5_04418 [Fulvia fulva]WPV28211.1 hypothetical protein CLAFUW7_04445 [Fulvia fulva]